MQTPTTTTTTPDTTVQPLGRHIANQRQSQVLNGRGHALFNQQTLAHASCDRPTHITCRPILRYKVSLLDRNIIKFNLTSHEMSLQPPGLFAKANDVKYFKNTSRGKRLCCFVFVRISARTRRSRYTLSHKKASN